MSAACVQTASQRCRCLWNQSTSRWEVEIPEVVDREEDKKRHQKERNHDPSAINSKKGYLKRGKPAAKDTRRGEEETFMEFALDIVNLAMVGEMDLRTIEAFLSWTGFCQVQDPIGRPKRMEKTEMMNACK
ncbi:MAG: hypothetical protein Q9174_003097 [Haloplaca sp. 1 TL-2023]